MFRIGDPVMIRKMLPYPIHKGVEHVPNVAIQVFHLKSKQNKGEKLRNVRKIEIILLVNFRVCFDFCKQFILFFSAKCHNPSFPILNIGTIL